MFELTVPDLYLPPTNEVPEGNVFIGVCPRGKADPTLEGT